MTQNLEPTQLFQTPSGALEIKIDSNHNNIWLTQGQIAQVFDKSVKTVNEHILNIFKEEEVTESECKQKIYESGNSGSGIDKAKNYYNLDLILSVGYRTNSKQATKFRQWASGILKDYLTKGYSLNQKLLEHKNQQVLEIRQTLDFLVKNNRALDNQDQFLNILSQYTESLVILNQFDEDRIVTSDTTLSVNIEITELKKIIAVTKSKLIAQNEATELFGLEYEGKFESSIGAVYQSFGGEDVYPTLEQKAANLLYLIIKNHGFADGNKRIGSILFIYFLAKNMFLHKQDGTAKITENTLVALALLIAQSRPEDKDIIVKLTVRLIQD